MTYDTSINYRSVPIYVPDPAVIGTFRSNDVVPGASNGGDISASVTTSPNKTDNSLQTSKDLRNAEAQGKRLTYSDEELIKAIEKANKAIQGPNTTCEFSIHEKTKAIMVKVMNKDTGEIIREIPPEKILDMVAKMCELAGVFVDEKR